MTRILAILLCCLSVEAQDLFWQFLAQPTAAAGGGGGPITFRGVGMTNSTANTTSYTCATSNAPSANSLVLVGVISCVLSGTPTIPTISSGYNMSFVQIGTTNYDTLGTPTKRTTLFRGMSASPDTTDLVVDFGAEGQSACLIRVVQFSGVDTSGTSGSGAVVQFADNGADADTTGMSVTLSALTGTDNAVYAFWGTDTTSGARNPEAGWTLDWEAQQSGPTVLGYAIFQLATTDNTPSMTWATSHEWSGLAVEVKVAP